VKECNVVELVINAMRQVTADVVYQKGKRGLNVSSSKGRGFVLEGCLAWLAGNSVAGN
jgi:hypothetical protein